MEQGTQGGPPDQPTYSDSEFAAYSRYTDEQLRLVMNTPGINGLTLAERLAAEGAPVSELMLTAKFGYRLLSLVRRRYCARCERCTWNPGSDCGVAEHPHCPTCGHCEGRHR